MQSLVTIGRLAAVETRLGRARTVGSVFTFALAQQCPSSASSNVQCFAALRLLRPYTQSSASYIAPCSHELRGSTLCGATASRRFCGSPRPTQGDPSANEESSSSASGTRFILSASQRWERQKKVRAAHAQDPQLKTEERGLPAEDRTKLQIQRLLKEMPGRASCTFAFMLHTKQLLEPKAPPMDRAGFESIFKDVQAKFFQNRAKEVTKRRRQRRDYTRKNSGYKEDEEVPQVHDAEFEGPWRQSSIVEDLWKSEYYQAIHREARKSIPERGLLATRTDRLADVAAAAYRKHITDQNRPVLTHELADFENPYMMRRSALDRLLQERCVRNQLDERCVPRLLDNHPDLVKLRAQAALPPEVLEPLAAFRGDSRWHFDSRERLGQKLADAAEALNAVLVEPSSVSPENLRAVADKLPENQEVRPDQVPGIHHPWHNHVGFESAVPTGVTGSTKFGQPMKAIEKQVLGLRYPTLQRVAHTLPTDPKWRAHVVRTINVLERSRDWDFQSKLAAINSLKEIYDQMKPSQEYEAALDEKLPVNRVPSHLKRKYARNAQYVKTFPKFFLKKKSFYRYRASLTATAPLKKAKAQDKKTP